MIVLTALTSCSSSPRSAEPSGSPVPPSQSLSTTAQPAVTFDQALHDELVGMFERDQAELNGRPQADTAEQRIARLKEIIREYGWPTFDLVGKDGENAAWVIAQHADLDPAFQQEALELLRAAVAGGQASPGNLAYLEDRVAVAKGEPQAYGTQMRCGTDGPVPATPIRDEAGVDKRRAEAGLPRLAAYLREMATICAEAADQPPD
ncbi:DUF6624 domain-containing protein [Micromonospora sp. NPDC049891]|uniref:DUF6624 domain-containing protein n=1 Tax=Micromonospora sp. NPDC049891 TaxID=3155655 RepID=UPI003402C0D2